MCNYFCMIEFPAERHTTGNFRVATEGVPLRATAPPPFPGKSPSCNITMPGGDGEEEKHASLYFPSHHLSEREDGERKN